MTDHDLLIELHSEIKALRQQLNGYVPNHCIKNEGRLDAVEVCVQEIKDDKKWLSRTAIAATIAAGLSLIANCLLFAIRFTH